MPLFPAGERGRLAGCVPRLAGHIFGGVTTLGLFSAGAKNSGRAPALPGQGTRQHPESGIIPPGAALRHNPIKQKLI